jgi:hypothetical protein
MNKNLLLAVLVGVATAVVFGLGGFFLINDKTGSMGATLFLLLPFATGFATALVARGQKLITASLLIGAIICTAILLLTKMEGLVCVLMSTPLIAFGLTVGALIGVLVRRQLLDKSRKPNVLSLLVLFVIPFFLMGANSAEEESRRTQRLETVTNHLVVDASPEIVWGQLKSVDKISGSKGLLMRIGLPVPVSCVMAGEGVGAKRTCYFESGYIEERVTAWNPPNSMRLEITDSDVPGRPWLTFKDASYGINQENGHTVITRKTTIVSRLSPAWYWRPLEKIGVETEHEYLFEELKKRINGAK